MTVSTLTKKGQITLHKNIREKLGLKEGDRVNVVCEGDEIIMKKVKEKSIVDSVAGTIDIDPNILRERKILSRFGEWNEEDHS